MSVFICAKTQPKLVHNGKRKAAKTYKDPEAHANRGVSAQALQPWMVFMSHPDKKNYLSTITTFPKYL